MLMGCETKSSHSFYEIVNGNFINFTDTVAYRYGTFFPAPNDTTLQSVNSTDKLFISADTFFTKSERLVKSLNSELTNRRLPEFSELLKEEHKASIPSLVLSKITNTDRYSLVATTVAKMGNQKFVGHINFVEPYIAADKAIIILSISSSPKAGSTSAFLIKKENDRWTIKDKIELERW